ncbi:MAG: amphi-Trp domain-containing protein [Archaeoglobi archaeon]|nr:amphi-Trp domain-containing protein [Archaeoglobi archaeon]
MVEMFGHEEVEYEAYLSKSELAELFRKLADQVEKEGKVEVSTQDGNISLEFTEPVEVKVEYDGGKRKLKIKAEFRQRAKLL